MRINGLKRKEIQLFLLFFCAILIYDVLFCNSVWVSSVLRGNFGITSYVFSFARCFVYLLLLFLLILSKGSLIRNRVLYDNEKKKYKIIKYVIFLFQIIAIVAMVVLYFFYNLSIMSMAVICLLLIYLIFVSLFYSKNYKLNILIICSVSFIFTITTDTIHPVDEMIHFTSAYNIAHGNFGDSVSYSDPSLDMIPGWGNFNTTQTLHVHYEKNCQLVSEKIERWPSVISQPLYFISASGIFISELLNGTIMDTFYMGRIFNAIVFLVGVAFLLKILPVKINAFVAIITTPFLLLMSGTYNVDGIGNISILLFCAYIIKLFSDRTKKWLDKKDAIIIIILSLLILFYKNSAYFFIFGLFALIYKKIPKNKRLFFWLYILVLLFLTYKLIFPSNISSGDSRGGDTNILGQLKFLFSSPFIFIRVYLMHTFNTFFNPVFYQELNSIYFFGTYSSYLTLIYFLYLIYMGLSSDDYKFKIGTKIYLLLIFFLNFYFTSTSLYLSFTPVGEYIIKGYQSRYIWAFLPLLLLVLDNKYVKIEKDKNYEMRNFTICLSLIMLFLYCDIFTRIFAYCM